MANEITGTKVGSALVGEKLKKSAMIDIGEASAKERTKANASVANSITRKQKRQARREARKEERAHALANPPSHMYSTDIDDEGRIKSRNNRLNIDRLRYQFDQGARPNRFEVQFFCPKLGLNLEGVRCVNATLPGRQLETADWSEYGPTRKLPYQLGMDGQEVSFTFLCDSTFADRFIIEAWQNAIFQGRSTEAQHHEKIGSQIAENKKLQESVRNDPDLRSKMGELADENKSLLSKMGDVGAGNSINPQFEYYENYVGEIIVKQITRSDKDSLVYRIHEAYPVSFNPMELNSDSTDELMKFETTFAFRTWESRYENPNPVSGINKGRRFFDAIASITNMRKGGNGTNNTLQRFNDRLAELGGIIG